MRSGRIGISLSALLIVLSLGALLGCQKKPAAKQPGVLAQVGKEVLTMEDFEQLIPPEYRTALGRPEKENLVNSWVNAELFYQAGLKKGLDKDKDIARKLKDTERQIIANEMLQREIGGKIQVSDQEAHKYYDSHLAEFGEEVHIRQILVPTEDQAKAILDTLAKGADFAKLAQERSMDPSGQGGGDVGFISRGTGVLHSSSRRPLSVSAKVKPPESSGRTSAFTFCRAWRRDR